MTLGKKSGVHCLFFFETILGVFEVVQIEFMFHFAILNYILPILFYLYYLVYERDFFVFDQTFQLLYLSLVNFFYIFPRLFAFLKF